MGETPQQRAEHERNARKMTEHQRAQGKGNPPGQRGGRSCGVALLLLSAATLGLAWPVFSLLGVI